VPTHGLVLWLDLPTAVDDEAVHAEAQRQGVLVSPSPMWTADPATPPGLRLAFCAESPPRLAEGARRLAKAIKNVLARAPEGREPPRFLEAV
jgi:DNA-binding transcriptional MocR family regulator